ncbi:MAG: cobalamin-dependent protein [Deltaproteobacteria bacterium]|nr:cobalamin-dependent protein [Deltaproteobacteria bacterium]
MNRYLDLDTLRRVDLPPGREVIHEGLERGGDIEIGRTAFMKTFGVRSEAEYKRRMISEKRVMFHAHIGLNSWEATAEALRFLYGEMERRGLRIDRFGLCLDRAMGLPPDLRRKMPRETGPRLETMDQWYEVGQVAPIQPHAGDFMIGFPNSVESTALALSAGITTIGNLSQFFAHEIPGWTDDVFTTVETAKALAMMAALKERGAMVHSYLDDGYGALFGDYATTVGWVMMERYILEDLIGASLAPCFGGMTSDPRMRFSWVLILKEIFGDSLVGSMFYGDTISYTEDMDFNLGVVAGYTLWDVLAQLYCPTGHAVTPIPVTEAVRVPSAQEILQVQVLGRRMEEAAGALIDRVDFSEEVACKDRLVEAGKRVFRSALEGLEAAGIDVEDPVRMLYVLKKLGPGEFEARFGAGVKDESHLHRRRPIMTVDYYKGVQEKSRALEETINRDPLRYRGLRGRRAVITSTDIHEHALFILERGLKAAGMEVLNIGPEKSPGQIAEALAECGAEVLAVSTHNGMAYEFAGLLREEFSKRSLKVPVFMGGRLNQTVEGRDLPEDVAGRLADYGIVPCEDVAMLLEELARLFS